MTDLALILYLLTKALGFPVVASSFRADAVAKLRIASDPSPTLLVESLATSPPTTVEKAKVCFEVSPSLSCSSRLLRLS